jgi:hypothetical protein
MLLYECELGAQSLHLVVIYIELEDINHLLFELIEFLEQLLLLYKVFFYFGLLH